MTFIVCMSNYVTFVTHFVFYSTFIETYAFYTNCLYRKFCCFEFSSGLENINKVVEGTFLTAESFMRFFYLLLHVARSNDSLSSNINTLPINIFCRFSDLFFYVFIHSRTNWHDVYSELCYTLSKRKKTKLTNFS